MRMALTYCLIANSVTGQIVVLVLKKKIDILSSPEDNVVT